MPIEKLHDRLVDERARCVYDVDGYFDLQYDDYEDALYANDAREGYFGYKL